MPKLTLSKDSLKGLPPLPAGVVEFRCDGFKPSLSKNGDSVNLSPQLSIINNPDLHNRRIMENLNSKFGRGIEDFCHALGVELVDNGDSVDIPGSFGTGDEQDPKKWPPYQGPLLGQQGKLELMEREYNGKPQTSVKRYFCKVPGCTVRHSESLQKAS